ncbi:uncharacterized protein [Nicotiana tomentosiformis]|uniref:uncharacterized protein n=1 Tax=Nicotiana tomentosiformis TaxID=4098 RepID=UPI00388C87E4
MIQHAYCNVVEEEIDSEPWFHDVKEYIKSGLYLVHATNDQKRTIRHLASECFLSGGILYKRISDLGLLRCIDAKQASTIMTEVHSRVHGDLIHSPPSELHTMSAPWPFVVWGMDVIGPIEPATSNGHRFILVAINYFTKWVEAVTFKSVSKKAVANFVHSNIICRFRIPKFFFLLNFVIEPWALLMIKICLSKAITLRPPSGGENFPAESPSPRQGDKKKRKRAPRSEKKKPNRRLVRKSKESTSARAPPSNSLYRLRDESEEEALVQQKIDCIDQLRAEMDNVKAETDKWRGGMNHLASKRKTAQGQLTSAETQLREAKEKAEVQAKKVEELLSQLSTVVSDR